MRGAISTKKIILGLSFVILIGIISFVILNFKLYTNGLVFANGLYSDIKRSLDPSKAIISLKNEDLVISLKINPADQGNLGEILNNLGIDKNLEDLNIKIKLGEETALYINKILEDNNLINDNLNSIIFNLRFRAKGIDFNNKKVYGIFESSNEVLLENPSVNGSIKTSLLGEKGYSIIIDNPEKVISEAMTSGDLKLSEELATSRWWQLLSKLATIKLKIDNGEVSGVIIFK
jgi:hypothetical protein